MKKYLITVLITILFSVAFAQNNNNEIESVISTAVEQIVKSQQEDGSWPYEGVYRVGGEIPIGYKVGGTAIVCQMLLFVNNDSDKEAAGAFSKGIDFILEGLEHPLMKPSTVNTYDVRLWGHSYALQLFCYLKNAGFSYVSSKQRASIEKWIPDLVKILLEEELPQGGWNYATRSQQATFVTGPVAQTLIWAKALGVNVPPQVLRKTKDVLLAARYSSGAFEYSGKKGMYDKPERSAIQGSIARSALAETTLYLLGESSIENIQNAVEAFHKYWDELEKRRKKPGTHEPPYGIAPYYFYFGHYYAAQAVEMLPENVRVNERTRLKNLIMKTIDSDGTWNDRIFERSKAYGTAMAVMTLISDRIPLAEKVGLK
ncbi:hypothetical protein ACFL4T_02420 [candidate division KSB1 bacterium]